MGKKDTFLFLDAGGFRRHNEGKTPMARFAAAAAAKGERK
jgi:hypothetical protein